MTEQQSHVFHPANATKRWQISILDVWPLLCWIHRFLCFSAAGRVQPPSGLQRKKLATPGFSLNTCFGLSCSSFEVTSFVVLVLSFVQCCGLYFPKVFQHHSFQRWSHVKTLQSQTLPHHRATKTIDHGWMAVLWRYHSVSKEEGVLHHQCVGNRSDCCDRSFWVEQARQANPERDRQREKTRGIISSLKAVHEKSAHILFRIRLLCNKFSLQTADLKRNKPKVKHENVSNIFSLKPR